MISKIVNPKRILLQHLPFGLWSPHNFVWQNFPIPVHIHVFIACKGTCNGLWGKHSLQTASEVKSNFKIEVFDLEYICCHVFLASTCLNFKNAPEQVEDKGSVYLRCTQVKNSPRILHFALPNNEWNVGGAQLCKSSEGVEKYRYRSSPIQTLI